MNWFKTEKGMHQTCVLSPCLFKSYVELLLLFSPSVMPHALQPHGLQHDRLQCTSSSPRVCSNSHLLIGLYHPNISCSVVPFSFCLQSFTASGPFLMNQLFTSSVSWRILSIALLACEMCNCVVVWTLFGIGLLSDWKENWIFPDLWPLLSFPNLLAYWV